MLITGNYALSGLSEIYFRRNCREPFETHMKTTTLTAASAVSTSQESALCQFAMTSMRISKWGRCASSPGPIPRTLTSFWVRPEQSSKAAKSRSLLYRFLNLTTIPFFITLYLNGIPSCLLGVVLRWPQGDQGIPERQSCITQCHVKLVSEVQKTTA